MDEFFDLMSDIHTSNSMITGVFNIHINQQTLVSFSLLHTCIEKLNLKQYIEFPTHNRGT